MAVWIVLGILCAGAAVIDAFQTIILPRRPVGRWRLTRIYFLATWRPWRCLAQRTTDRRVREQILAIYGPMSLLFLLTIWAVLLIVGFAFILYGLHSPFFDSVSHANVLDHMRTDLYVSGTTLTTLGPGDVIPRSHTVRALMILESGAGLGFVALVIGYLPVLYTAFSRREVSIALLDARAGSPPTAAELLTRHGFDGGHIALIELMAEWERWCAELLESHISYPVLCYYRSQHDNQSWLASLTALLDACALVIAGVEGVPARQAQLTFAIARHALVDLGHVFHIEKRTAQIASGSGGESATRLPPDQFDALCGALAGTEVQLCAGRETMQRLTKLRSLYEPQAQALSEFLLMPLPPWIAEQNTKAMWSTVNSLRRDAATELAPARPASESQDGISAHASAGEGHDSRDEFGMHVSRRAASFNLGDDEQHGI